MIFNKDRDMVKILKNFMEFFVEESCGQCTPCRIGNVKLLEGVEMIENNNYTFAYINELKELGKSMQIASKCGLGQSSPNSFISILDNFKDEVFNTKRNGGNNG
jgi:[NiFe] hydrogenase diaphorase moiety large subunit